MKKLFSALVLIPLTILLSGYKFPEKLPAPFDFDTYTFEKVKFGQTSINEFAYLAPTYEKPEVEGVYTIYKELELDKTYKSLRAGFKNNFLDWVELEFAVPQSWSKFQENYGKPLSVNKDYSKKFNYQDYKFFNVVTDKNNAVVFGVTLYGESDYNPSIAKVVAGMPDYKNFNFINEFIAGQLMENDFNAKYPNFESVDAKDVEKKCYSVPAKYLKHNNYYRNIDLVFANGILLFVNLIPKNLYIKDIKEIYGEGKQEDIPNKKTAFLNYQNFVVTYDKETTKVLNIGIVGAN